jgi:hypothetical protein
MCMVPVLWFASLPVLYSDHRVCVCVVLQAIWGTLSAPSCDITVVC